MKERYKLNSTLLNEIVDTEGYYGDPSSYYSLDTDKNRIVDLLNNKEKKIKEQEQKIKSLKCSIDALNYVLRYVKGIEVQIDIKGDKEC